MSVLKLAALLLGASTVLTATHATRQDNDYWFRWVFTFAVVMVALSLPLLPLPYGYTRNGRGFQGILSHPQTYGPMVAVFCALIIGRWLTRGRLDRVQVLVVLTAMATVWASQSRTAVLALLGGGLLTGAVALLWRADWRRRLTTIPVAVASGIVSLMLLFTVFGYWDVLRQVSYEFMQKGHEIKDVRDFYATGRGEKYVSSFANYLDHPATGIGFGIASDVGDVSIVRDPFFGLPIGASTEKGLIVTAVLEETGSIGAIFFVLLVGAVLAPIIRFGTPEQCLPVCTYLATNAGEATLLAIGGTGMLYWAVMAASIAKATNGEPGERRRRALCWPARPTRSSMRTGCARRK